MAFSDSHHFRKMVAGACMVLGPLLALGSFVVSPTLKSDALPQLVQYRLHEDRLLISTFLAITAIALLVPATLGLMHMLRDRMAGYGSSGGAMALIGLLASMAQVGTGFMLWQMVRDGIQLGDVSAMDGLTHDAATVIPLFVIPCLGALGYVVLAAGLYQARAVDWWMAAMVAIGPIAITISGFAAVLWLGIAGSAILLVGLGSIGLMVLRETDAEWEHTRDYDGFRPAMHMG